MPRHATPLTKRQKQVLGVYFRGGTISAMAKEIGITRQQIFRHLANIRELLGVQSNREITQALVEQYSRQYLADRVLPSRLSVLAPREVKVALYAATGMTNGEIAEVMGLKRLTVNGYMGNVYHKLGIPDRTRLTIFMIHSGVMPAPISKIAGRLCVLGERENQVAYLAAQGYRAWEIAEELEISLHTAKNHLTAIYRKLGLTDQKDLIIVAAASGWVQLHTVLAKVEKYAEVARKFDEQEFAW